MSRTASVLIQGDFVDSYLYGGLVLAWDGRGRLVILRTDVIAAAAADATSTARSLSRAAFVDNKALAKPEVRKLVRRSGLAATNSEGEAITHLNLDDLRPTYFEVDSSIDVLDLMVTYGRLFISTDDALLSVPFDGAEVGDVRRRLSHRCLSTVPRWGAVSVSCAETGAWALLNEFGAASAPTRRTEQIDDDVSIRLAWLGTSLLSFGEGNSIDLFKGAVPMRKGEHRVAEGFTRAAELGDDADVSWWLSDDEDPFGLRASEFLTSFPRLLVSVRDGSVFATRVSTWSGFPQPFGDNELVARVLGRVHSIVDTDAGFVIETSESLHYASQGHSDQLVARETISLRAYPRSKRHRRAVSATVDGGLLITALLGIHELAPADRAAG